MARNAVDHTKLWKLKYARGLLLLVQLDVGDELMRWTPPRIEAVRELDPDAAERRDDGKQRTRRRRRLASKAAVGAATLPRIVRVKESGRGERCCASRSV